MSQQATPPMSLMRAMDVLGISGSITPEQIREAFRQKVKLADDQHGGYHSDMDDVSKAKEILLAEYEKHCPGSRDAYRARSEAARKQHLRQSQGSLDAIHARAQCEEEEENRQRRAREARQQDRAQSEQQQATPEEEAHTDAPLTGKEEPEAPQQDQTQEKGKEGTSQQGQAVVNQITAALKTIEAYARQQADQTERREQDTIQTALFIEEQLFAIEQIIQSIRAGLDTLIS